MDSIEAAPVTSSGTGAETDVAAERARTVGAGLSHHFNAAGSALPSHGVMAAVVDHLRLEERHGGYEAAAAARERTEDVYAAAAELIGARAHEIALFDSASTGLRVLVDALRPGRGERVIASSTTYVSHALHLMAMAGERGVELVVAPVDGRRRVDLDALDALLADGRPSILTVSHIPTSSGLVEPVEGIGAIARRHRATYILDATQSVGHLNVDVGAIGCDALVTTGRKFLRGPRGTGFAYVGEPLFERLTPTAPDVRGARWVSASGWELSRNARRFESWESAVAARLGLGAALREAIARSPRRTERWLRARAALLRSALADLPGVRIADPEGPVSAIVTFVVDGVESPAVVDALAARNVRVVSVPATHGQWDLGARALPSVVRASVHVYNDEADIGALVDAVRAVAAGRGGEANG
ncbi:aminotransferase class V-fold PLP-dependent enzyme [Streptomyces sp. PT12]|uniref:aminotransferase class V-fold PLP-dependent enzyme n=1 Tax=Streptomyces sp. PT12 TaxID=1510197 RepID=UPI000DE20121|nr:aminotransferase class V-fold PLP-dependent enzyme [Streptomyces sp. PT12]RBM06263.1 aminotransferase [Streptomyces sp. PT12]